MIYQINLFYKTINKTPTNPATTPNISNKFGMLCAINIPKDI